MIKKKEILFLLLISLMGYVACSDYTRNKAHPQIKEYSIRKGEQLAKQYCSGCHMFPEPSLLNVSSWEDGVLPVMGPMMGIFRHHYFNYPNARKDSSIGSAFYPSKPLLSTDEWQSVIDYYIAVSPDTLEMPVEAESSSLEGFLPNTLKIAVAEPTTSFLQIDTLTGTFWFSDLFSHRIYRADHQMNLLDSILTDAEIVHMAQSDNELYLTNIGNINPNNGILGEIRRYHREGAGRYQEDKSFLTNRLARPVQLAVHDFDNNGYKDFLIAEFGYLKGALTLILQSSAGKFNRKTLKNAAGAEQLVLNDADNDGDLDIWVLFAQGDESIVRFNNQGKGEFKEELIMRFPPMFGSTFFELTDVNGDGYQDIVYTCGDNADYSQVLKPYHGIYIFQNNKNGQFSQSQFLHLNGCYKALARDFDNDGDRDIAAISFFPNMTSISDDSFAYFQNEGNDAYSKKILNDRNKGRWISMDAGDLDGDGKQEIVLGNFSYGPVFSDQHPKWSNFPSILLLKNVK